MGKYKLEITLLSDLCVSDGSGFASMLDTDICYDKLGFPYIPARRLKGCLRECAQELKDWGKEIAIDELFGEEGHHSAVFRMGNAYLRDYQKMKAMVEENENHIIFHPQNILNLFSYIRTQTAMNYETGVADEGSLRTMRVANKGLVFEAEITMDVKYKKDLSLCCQVLTGMGIARTRGLGEVSVCLLEADRVENGSHAILNPDANYLEYEISVEEPIICKDTKLGVVNTMDYIEGSKMLGLIVAETRNTEIGDLICSNAYIGKNGVRYTEVPAFYYEIKGNKEKFINQIYYTVDEKENIQLNMMKHCYIMEDNAGLTKKNVAIEEHYHHRRPDDKSIGRAVESAKDAGKSTFYQMSSISSGQKFYGYVVGTPEQIKEIYDCIVEKEVFYIGKSKNAEYGKVCIRVIDTKISDTSKKVSSKEFIVKLDAPAIVYNDKAFYSMDVTDLEKEINARLGINVKPFKTYMNYTTLGGYNVTWRMRKPVVEAFDKGSVLYYKLDEPVELCAVEGCHIGERIHEGYGEISVIALDDAEKAGVRKYADTLSETGEIKSYVVETGSFVEKICMKLLERYVELSAINESKSFFKDMQTDVEKYRATVSNMMLMAKEFQTFEEIKEAVAARYKDRTDKKSEKLEYANKILNYVEEKEIGLIKNFCNKYQLEWSEKMDVNTLRMWFLKEFLIAMKYDIRKNEMEKN